MEVTPDGMISDCRLLQYPKAQFPIFVKLLDKEIFFSEEQPRKALVAMLVMVFGSVTDMS